MVIFIVIYLLALCCYFYTRFMEDKKYRVINKYLMATMYLVLALITFFRKYSLASYQSLYIVAVILAYFGDVFLVIDFSRGGDFFLAGNICFTVYEMAVLADHGFSIKDYGWVYLLVLIILGCFIFACSKYPDKIRMGKMRWPMTLYLATILAHGFTGLAMVLYLPGSKFMLMGIGSILFMISDMILTAYRFIFGNNKWLIRANSLTYFVGLLLIVISMV